MNSQQQVKRGDMNAKMDGAEAERIGALREVIAKGGTAVFPRG
jgi:hypothetical protein